MGRLVLNIYCNLLTTANKCVHDRQLSSSGTRGSPASMAETASPLTLGLHNRRKNILAGVILVQKAMRTAFTKNIHISR